MRKLLIVDDHRMFADGVRFLLEQSMEYEVVGILQNGREVVPFLANHPAHLLLLDIDLPDMSGFDVLRAIRPLYSTLNVLILSMLNDAQSVNRAVESGAAGYCLKTAGQEELFKAIRQVEAGQRYLPPEYLEIQHSQKNNTTGNGLTERETEVIRLIAEGINTRQIASKLCLSARTVETHRKNIYRKLGIHTNVELTLYARNSYLI